MTWKETRLVHRSLPAELVEYGNVGVHVVDVVCVGGVLGDVPLFWLGTLSGEHVSTVFGLIIHTVKACHLQTTSSSVNNLPYVCPVMFWHFTKVVLRIDVYQYMYRVVTKSGTFEMFRNQKLMEDEIVNTFQRVQYKIVYELFLAL